MTPARRRTALAARLAGGWLAAGAGAQSSPQGEGSRAALERRLEEARRQRARQESRGERLVDVVVRASLGLPTGDVGIGLTELERTRPRAQMEAELADALEHVAELGGRVTRLRDRLEQRRAEIARAAERRAEDDGTGADSEYLAVPPVVPPELLPAQPAGETAVPRRAAEGTDPEPRAEAPADGAGEDGADGGDDASQPLLLRGSADPGLLGRALFHAGEPAKAKLQLEKVAGRADAPLLDLFVLARAYEALGEQARADGIYLRIEEADTERQADGTDELGPWGRAARMARQHMSWMAEHGSWEPDLPGGVAPAGTASGGAGEAREDG